MNFPSYAPSKYHCKKCNRSPLWIEAFTYEENGETLATPMLVCDSHYGCGSIYAPSDYNLKEKDLCR
jgi:hypothetical protein